MQNNQSKMSSLDSNNTLLVRNLLDLPAFPYATSWEAMRQFTQMQPANSTDEVWLLQHQPIYTLGKAGDEKHLIKHQTDIPLLRTDRGGQITYHGPGQWMIYCLWDLKRLNIGIRSLVQKLQQLISNLCLAEGITAHTCENAPGVYVDDKKICAIGLRVSRGRCYHGLACNIQLDLTPFDNINPCGNSELKATSWQQELNNINSTGMQQQLQWRQLWLNNLQQQLGDIFAFDKVIISNEMPVTLSNNLKQIEAIKGIT